MAALHQLASFIVGDTWEIEGRLFRGDGDPLDLTGGAVIKWRMETPARAIIFDMTVGNGITIVDAATGVISIIVTPEQSAGVAVGKYTDQLQVTDVNGEVSTQWLGEIQVKRSFFVPGP